MIVNVLEACHTLPVGGNHSVIRNAKNILLYGYYVLTIYQDAHELSKSCDKCQIDGGILKRQEIPLNYIMVIELFNVWRIDFTGPFVNSHGMNYLLVAVDYVLKWVEAIVLSNNEGKTVTSFLKSIIFSRYGTPRAIIGDGGSHFCNRFFKGLF